MMVHLLGLSRYIRDNFDKIHLIHNQLHWYRCKGIHKDEPDGRTNNKSFWKGIQGVFLVDDDNK